MYQVGDSFDLPRVGCRIPVGDGIVKAYPLVESNVCHWVLCIEAQWVFLVMPVVKFTRYIGINRVYDN